MDLLSLHDIPSYLSGPTLLVVLTAMGLGVGILTGLFGVGGAFVLTPLMNVLLGVPYSLGTGCSMSFTIGTGAAGWAQNMRLGNVATKSMIILAGGSICGTVLGQQLHEALLDHFGDEGFTLMMHGLFIVILLLTAWMIARWSPREKAGLSLLQRLPIGPHIEVRLAGLKGVSLPGMCAVGLVIGVLKGLMGIGGGVLLMPIMLLVVGLTIRHAIGTSLGVVLFSSIAGAVLYGRHGQANLWMVMALLAGSTTGVQIGVWLCHRWQADRIRRYFAWFILGVIAMLAWDLVHKLISR